MDCPVCGAKLNTAVCPACGYDASADAQARPTLTRIDGAASIAARRAAWEKAHPPETDGSYAIKRPSSGLDFFAYQPKEPAPEPEEPEVTYSWKKTEDERPKVTRINRPPDKPSEPEAPEVTYSWKKTEGERPKVTRINRPPEKPPEPEGPEVTYSWKKTGGERPKVTRVDRPPEQTSEAARKDIVTPPPPPDPLTATTQPFADALVSLSADRVLRRGDPELAAMLAKLRGMAKKTGPEDEQAVIGFAVTNAVYHGLLLITDRGAYLSTFLSGGRGANRYAFEKLHLSTKTVTEPRNKTRRQVCELYGVRGLATETIYLNGRSDAAAEPLRKTLADLLARLTKRQKTLGKGG